MLNEIARLTEEKRDRLAEALEPIFGDTKDASGAATILVRALSYEFPEPIKKEDRPRYLAALERLPKGSSAKPHVYFVSIFDKETDPHWRVTFSDGCVQYQCLRRFATKSEAGDYASDFLVRLRGEINRP
jgi:hypothetical protein